MTTQEGAPEIHVDWIEVATTGANMTPSEEVADRVARQTDTRLVRWLTPEQRGGAFGPEATLDSPVGSISICDHGESTEILAENQTEDLDELIELLAAVAAALAHAAGNPWIGGIEIRVAMGTDRHPPLWPVAAQMTHSRFIQTEPGIRLHHSVTSRRVYDLEEDSGQPWWDLITAATAQVNEMPDAHTMGDIITATCTEAYLTMKPELHNEDSAPRPLQFPAHEVGPYGDVAAAEIERVAEICDRFGVRSAPLGAVASIMALSGCMGNAELIRPQLTLIDFDVPSLAQPAAQRIDRALEKMDQEHEPIPLDDRSEPDWTDQNMNITVAAAHTMSLAAKRHAIAHCAARMNDRTLPRYTRQVYRDIAERIINASTHHLDCTIGQLEMENEMAALHPEMAWLMEDILSDAGADAMAQFHQACQTLEAANRNA